MKMAADVKKKNGETEVKKRRGGEGGAGAKNDNCGTDHSYTEDGHDLTCSERVTQVG